MSSSRTGSVLRHTLLNLAGFGLPLVVAVFTIPGLIRNLGEERFGLLTLIWAIVGYFGVFDLGLGRALTQQISVLVAHGREDRIGKLVTTSLVIMAALGAFAGIMIWVGAAWAVSLIKGVTDREDAVGALRIMALAMPFIVLTSGLRGILEARFAFGALNMIRIPMGLLTFLGPLAVVAWWSSRLAPVAAVLTLGRVVASVAHAWFARRDLFVDGFDRSQLRPLLAPGSWLTVSNVVSPLMSYADRFIIGATISAGAVAYYTTPNEMILKIWIIPGALTAVLFPRFAQQVVGDPVTAWLLFRKAVDAVFLVTFPIALALAIFAQEILGLWVGWAFAEHSASVLKVFAAGMVIVCVAQVPYTLIQSANRVRITAFIHCGMLGAFVTVLFFATKAFGLMGAVSSWFLRVVVDALLMFYFGAQTMGHSVAAFTNRRTAIAVAAPLVLFSGSAIKSLWVRVPLLAAGFALTAYLGLPYLRQIQPPFARFIAGK